MRLIDVINGQWAITPEMLAEIQGIYARHMRGEKLDLADLEARIGAPLNNEPQGYDVIDGVAVLPVDGVIAKRMNLFSRISGGTSSQLVLSDLNQALADKSVAAIVLAIDSPGGTVDGTQELAQAIFAAREIKPILAHTDGLMASAAYWIGAAAERITISSDTTIVGSIGVVTSHVDISGMEAKAGVKTTEISAGKYKRIASQYGPLTAEAQAVIQSDLDYVYGRFVDDVAAFRGTSVEDVLVRMADGKTFRGKQAIDNGLVDGVATLAETIEQARELARTKKTARPAGVAAAATHAKEKHMDISTLKAEHPETVQAIIAEATEGMITKEAAQEAASLAGKAGADAERQRIAAVRAQSIPGHEALIEQLAMDGTTSGPEAAAQVLSAEKEKRAQALAAMEAGGSPVVPDAAAPVGDSAQGGTLEERAKAQWDKDEPLRAEFGGKFESFLAYQRNAESGRARVLGRK